MPNDIPMYASLLPKNSTLVLHTRHDRGAMRLKIISLNIWRGELLENAVNFLKKERPDIVMLQEVTNEQKLILPKRYRLLMVLQNELVFCKKSMMF